REEPVRAAVSIGSHHPERVPVPGEPVVADLSHAGNCPVAVVDPHAPLGRELHLLVVAPADLRGTELGHARSSDACIGDDPGLQDEDRPWTLAGGTGRDGASVASPATPDSWLWMSASALQRVVAMGRRGGRSSVCGLVPERRSGRWTSGLAPFTTTAPAPSPPAAGTPRSIPAPRRSRPRQPAPPCATG